MRFDVLISSAETVGFETQREAFLGPYRAWDKPAAVERGVCRLESPAIFCRSNRTFETGPRC
jgi:Glycosyltransferase family 36